VSRAHKCISPAAHIWLVGWFIVCNATFHNIWVMAVSFIGGENRSTEKKTSTLRKSPTNFIT